MQFSKAISPLVLKILFFLFFSGSEILWRLTHYNIIFAKKNFSMSKFRIFEKSPIFKKSNLTFKNFLKIEKEKF